MEDASMDVAASHVRRSSAGNYVWRLLATGASFVLFGLGGLVLRVIVLPVLGLLPGDAATRRRRAETHNAHANRGRA